jgi:cyclopropane fatty-acyl-phospholipid synthase-like methyltransferase
MISNPSTMPMSHKPHRFPWWLAPLLTNPVRRLLDNPETLLGDLVQPGHVVLELGPANGFYSVPIARALGESGKLIAVDIEPHLLKMLAKRLKQRGLADCLVPRLTQNVELELADLTGTADRIVAANVIHELPKPRETLFALAATLKDGGQFLLVEPPGHVSRERFETELRWLQEAGLRAFAPELTARTRRMCARLQKSTVPVFHPNGDK